jgi:hypothetical protein
MTAPHTRTRLIPWADAAFVEGFERARDQAIVEGMAMPGPEAAGRVERLLRGRVSTCDRRCRGHGR